jgi:plasmid maintenance system antidote protein VapI
MSKPDEPMPAQAFPVGAYVRDELEARGWSIQEFVTRMFPIQSVRQRSIDMLAVDFLLTVDDPGLRMGDMAGPMAKALGVSVEFLTNLERAYVEWAAVQTGGEVG